MERWRVITGERSQIISSDPKDVLVLNSISGVLHPSWPATHETKVAVYLTVLRMRKRARVGVAVSTQQVGRRRMWVELLQWLLKPGVVGYVGPGAMEPEVI